MVERVQIFSRPTCRVRGARVFRESARRIRQTDDEARVLPEMVARAGPGRRDSSSGLRRKFTWSSPLDLPSDACSCLEGMIPSALLEQ